MNLYSYIVRYDSGFAPNPFYKYCTLATCKPRIRKNAEIGDWLVGCGSASQKINQGGKLVYAMQISESLTFEEYFADERFKSKKPVLTGSRKQARGDNIYYKEKGAWKQLDSFHSNKNGTENHDHINRDTGTNRVLISNQYKYFGMDGPSIPTSLSSGEKTLCHKGRGESKFSKKTTTDRKIIEQFLHWLDEQGEDGYNNHPFDWNDNHLPE